MIGDIATDPSPAPRGIGRATAETMLVMLARRANAGVWPAYVLFFLMLFVPTAYQPVKAAFLLLLLLFAFIKIITRGGLALHHSIFLWVLFYVLLGLFFMLHGLMNNAPGADAMKTVYVVWPLVFIFLIGAANQESLVPALFRVMLFATLAIEFYFIYSLMHVFGYIPEAWFVPLKLGIGVGLFVPGTAEITMLSTTSLLFMAPCLLAIVLTWPRSATALPRFWVHTALFLGFGLVIISGRRGLWVVMALAPFLIYFFQAFQRKQFKMPALRSLLILFGMIFLGVIGIYFMLTAIFHINIGKILEDLLRGFQFQAESNKLEAGAYARKMQYMDLIAGWREHPLLGAGHGATVGWKSDPSMPWAYEISYLALMFHTGLIGLIAYASGVVWIFFTGMRLLVSGHRLSLYMLPTLVGASCFLAANATNPYLEKFDYMWVIFLPVLIINIWLHSKQAGRTEP